MEQLLEWMEIIEDVRQAELKIFIDKPSSPVYNRRIEKAKGSDGNK